MTSQLTRRALLSPGILLLLLDPGPARAALFFRPADPGPVVSNVLKIVPHASSALAFEESGTFLLGDSGWEPFRPTSKCAGSSVPGQGTPVRSSSQCFVPLSRWLPPDSTASRSTTGLVNRPLAGVSMPSHWRAKKSVSCAWCSVMPGSRVASRQNASTLRKPARQTLNGHCVQSSWRKRGSSSAAPAGAWPSSPAAKRTVSMPNCAARAANSIWRPGDTPRCQAQSAQASDSDTGDRSPSKGAAAACSNRSRRSVGGSSPCGAGRVGSLMAAGTVRSGIRAFLPAPRAAARRDVDVRCVKSNVEQEVHHVAIPDDVLLAL